jgi:hypothetical protein
VHPLDLVCLRQDNGVGREGGGGGDGAEAVELDLVDDRFVGEDLLDAVRDHADGDFVLDTAWYYKIFRCELRLVVGIEIGRVTHRTALAVARHIYRSLV